MKSREKGIKQRGKITGGKGKEEKEETMKKRK